LKMGYPLWGKYRDVAFCGLERSYPGGSDIDRLCHATFKSL
jgi:hypothetical protein